MIMLLSTPVCSPTKTPDLASLNKRVVGISLKANGKRYFVSSELCPGGIFLTRPVNENCLCYNGIFEVVRDCCRVSNTRIHTDTLEWRMNYKCGTSEEIGVPGGSPIRAILPLTKPYNRFGSVILPRAFIGNTSQWRKYDTGDIIMRNRGKVTFKGKSQIEIVNVKPLGREIRVRFGPETNTIICYRGWTTDAHQNIRIRVTKTMTNPPPTCCFNITKANTPGVVTADCTTGTIVTELINVKSAEADAGNCDAIIEDNAPHKLNKRQSIYKNGGHHNFLPHSYDPMQLKFPTPNSLNYDGSDVAELGPLTNLLEDRGPILIKRQANYSQMDPVSNLEDVGGGHHDGTFTAILPRRRGISGATFKEQAMAINEFVAIFRNDPDVELREPQTFRFKLLKKAFDIFMKVIPNDILPHVMLKTAYDVFYFLYEEMEPFINKPPEAFNTAMKFLDTCLNMEQQLNFSTVGCPREIDELVVDPLTKKKLETYYDGRPAELEKALKALHHIEIRKDRRFIMEVFDVYVEINWKVADFVHSFCFEHFSSRFNAHHFFETALEEIFRMPEVQQRWFSRANDLRYARGVFGTSNLKLRMKQLDKITTVGHSLSRYNGSYWLYRPNLGDIPWLYQVYSNKDDPKVPGILPGTMINTGPRLAFAQNMMDEESGPAGAIESRVRSAEDDRKMMYPYRIPSKLKAGQVIWDGIAVCLHAKTSNRRRYFLDNKSWGITPSLQQLGEQYS